MSNLVIILGKSGTGKSTSIKSLNPDETVIVNVLNKRLPFKGSNSMYNSEKHNIMALTNYKVLTERLSKINTEKNYAHIKNIVIDDMVYLLRTEFFDNASTKGFDKYNIMADNYRRIIALCSNMRSDLNIFLMLHSETEESEGNIISYKASSVGKLLDKMYNPIENVTTVLYSEPRFDENGNPTFGFYTRKVRTNGIELPAKTPEGMFEEDFIPNDLAYVINKMNEYYN
jgi:hypothetical protein